VHGSKDDKINNHQLCNRWRSPNDVGINLSNQSDALFVRKITQGNQKANQQAEYHCQQGNFYGYTDAVQQQLIPVFFYETFIECVVKILKPHNHTPFYFFFVTFVLLYHNASGISSG
jgi:hypothetical protein